MKTGLIIGGSILLVGIIATLAWTHMTGKKTSETGQKSTDHGGPENPFLDGGLPVGGGTAGNDRTATMPGVRYIPPGSPASMVNNIGMVGGSPGATSSTVRF